MDTVRNDEFERTDHQLSNDFAQGVLAAIRAASLEQFLGDAQPRPLPRRLARPRTASGHVEGLRTRPGQRRAAVAFPAARKRSSAAIGDKVIDLLKAHPEGLRSKQIRLALDIVAKELPRPLKDLLGSKKIKSKGQKRATTYFAK